MTSREQKTYPHTGRKEGDVGPEFWAGHYKTGETRWDHGEASPGLVDFLKTHVGAQHAAPVREGEPIRPSG